MRILEKIKEFWNQHKIGVIVGLTATAIILLSLGIALSYKPSVDGKTGMYGILISWGMWFDPILKSLVGIACIKYILLDWK